MSEESEVLVKFFASARDIVGKKDLKMEIQQNWKVEDVLETIFKKYPELEEMEDQLLISVNKDRTKKNEVLKDGDEIAVMPPVTGG
ncbi:MAG: molybdopterin converting factor subunit 1 [Candidatus Thermoplasmatota archaeon]|nr:molybdopterin converting factor subunit 1 [Candidatus Thermoplasmatota archaeon]